MRRLSAAKSEESPPCFKIPGHQVKHLRKQQQKNDDIQKLKYKHLPNWNFRSTVQFVGAVLRSTSLDDIAPKAHIRSSL